MTTLRETRHREAINSIARVTAQRDGCLANLVRYETRLKLLRKQLARLERTMAAPPKPAPVPSPAPVEAAPSPPATVAMAPGIPQWDEPIPAFLDRRKQIEQRDAATLAEMEQTKAEKKRRKSLGRIAKLKAKDAGELKKMPLTGRAALEKIRAG